MPLFLQRSMIWYYREMPSNTSLMQYIEISKRRSPRELKWKLWFYTVGETFSGDAGLLNLYIGETMLDGQFDFDLYWNIWEPLEEMKSRHMKWKCLSKMLWYRGCKWVISGNHIRKIYLTCRWWCCFPYGDGLVPMGIGEVLLSLRIQIHMTV